MDGDIYNTPRQVGGYDAITPSSYRDFMGLHDSQSEDERLTGYNLSKIRQLAQNVRRNNPAVSGVLQRFSENALGIAGLSVKPMSRDAAWNLEAADWFQAMKDKKLYDHRGELSMDEHVGLIIETRPTDGESFSIFKEGGKVLPVEAERCITPSHKSNDPKVVAGILKAASGGKRGYYFCGRNSAGVVSADKWAYFSADHVVHTRRPFRIDQRRGIPDLSTIINKLVDVADVDAGTLAKMKKESRFGLKITSDRVKGPAANTQRAGVPGAKVDDNGVLRKDQKRAVMSIDRNIKGLFLEQGADAEFLESKTPHGNYLEYMEYCYRIISAGLNVPYEFLMLDFRKGSFSQDRTKIIMAERSIQYWFKHVRDQYLKRWWNWRAGLAIANGELSPAPVNEHGVSEWNKVDWVFGGLALFDRKKEAEADALELNIGKIDLDDIGRRLGKTGAQLIEGKAAMITALQVEADKINKAHPGAGVSWRDLLNIGVPGQQVPVELVEQS